MDAITVTVIVAAVSTSVGALMIGLLGRTPKPGVSLGYVDPMTHTTTELPSF